MYLKCLTGLQSAHHSACHESIGRTARRSYASPFGADSLMPYTGGKGS